MHIAVRYKDGTKNLLKYNPSEEYSTAQMIDGAKEMLEEQTGKTVAVILVQVSDTKQAVEKQTA